jgi:hypothetical protein
MEVHQHPHPAHGKKNWKSYFWEFLMLFLAVTLGFFVENQREHYIEHQRAKRFAASLYEDLQADTAEIHMNHTYIENLFLCTDSVLIELVKPGNLQNDTILQLRGTRRLLVFDLFDPQMGNYEQIKNSGALRYFNQELVKKLTFYESRKNRLVLQKQEYLDFINSVVTPFCIKMANAKFLDPNKPNLSSESASIFITKPDKEILNQWQNMIFILRRKLEEHKTGIGRHEVMSMEIMEDLRKEYHLN